MEEYVEEIPISTSSKIYIGLRITGGLDFVSGKISNLFCSHDQNWNVHAVATLEKFLSAFWSLNRKIITVFCSLNSKFLTSFLTLNSRFLTTFWIYNLLTAFWISNSKNITKLYKIVCPCIAPATLICSWHIKIEKKIKCQLENSSPWARINVKM